MIVVVMGVAGSGKSTVGRLLARRWDARFLDADDVHSASSRAKMQRGEALSDADRAPWLATLRSELLTAKNRGESVVLACSALRRTYREALQVGGVRFVYLDVPGDVLRERLSARSGHYAGPALLGSQLATLEVPSVTEALWLKVGASDTPEDLVARILQGWREAGA